MLKRIIGAAVVASALTLIPLGAASADGSCHTSALVDPAYVACQQAEFAASQAAEAARIAALPASAIPAGTFLVKADAIAYAQSVLLAGGTLAVGDDGFLFTTSVHVGGGKSAPAWRVVVVHPQPPLQVVITPA